MSGMSASFFWHSLYTFLMRLLNTFALIPPGDNLVPIGPGQQHDFGEGCGTA
jgi:hypothetical protein